MRALPWSFDVMTLFPKWFDWLFECRPIQNVVESGTLELGIRDMRAYSPLAHNQVDDLPYGGGPGMVLRVDAVAAAMEGAYDLSIEAIRSERRVVLLTPAGRQFSDTVADAWVADGRPVTVLCGRYEGFDHRVHEHIATEEISVGRYVLSGGEPAAMSIVDTVARKLPGALGNADSLREESFSDALGGGSEYPHYTRPEEFRGWTVPPILLQGHHARIAQWRAEKAAARTAAKRT